MASINQISLRDELDRLKGEFVRLSTETEISGESKILMRSMLALLELICAIFLEKKTTKTSQNSSKPSSQTDKDDSALEQPGPHGKGKIEKHQSAYNSRTIETVTTSRVETCDTCGEDLTKVTCDHYERRTKIDILFEKVVEHIDAEIKQCPSCCAQTKGTFPADMVGPLQYGNGLKAYVINLLVCQMVALNRVQKLIASMIGQVLSEATLLKFVFRLHEALADWEQNAIEQLLKSPVMHVDETSLRVDKQNHWIHVYAANGVTLKRLHRKRGKEAIEDIQIIPKYGGVIVHDCWASYLSYTHCGHGLCGSHLLRELTFIVDSNGYAWARNIKRLLQETCKAVSSREEKCLTENEYKTKSRRFRRSAKALSE